MSGVSRQAGKAAAAAATAAVDLGLPAARHAGDDLRRWPGCTRARSARGATSTGAPSIQWDRMGGAAVSAGGRTSVVIGDASLGLCDRTRGSGGLGSGSAAGPVSCNCIHPWPLGPGRARSGRRLVACRTDLSQAGGGLARPVEQAPGPAAACGMPAAGGSACGVIEPPFPDRRRDPEKVPAPRSAGDPRVPAVPRQPARLRSEQTRQDVDRPGDHVPGAATREGPMSTSPATDPMTSRGDRPPRPGAHVLLVVRPGRDRPDRDRPRGGDLPLHPRGPPDHRLQQPADVGEPRPRRPPCHRRHRGPGGEAAVRPAGLRHGDPGAPRRQDGRDHAGRPRQGLLHARRGRGRRERDQARPPLHGPDEGAGPVPHLPRRHAGGDDAHRRPAPLGQRAGDLRGRALPRHPPLGREGAPTGGGGAPGPRGRDPYEGPHTIAAVFLETIVGTNGILIPPDGYLARASARSATATGS